MRRIGARVTTMAITIASLVGASRAAGQTPGVTLGFYGGGSAFSDLQRQNLMLVDATSGARRTDDQTVAAQPGGVAGLRLGYWPSSRWGIRLQGGYGRSSVQLQRGSTMDSEDSGSERAPMDVLGYGGDVLLRLPVHLGDAQPYAIAGAGAVTYRLRPTATGASATWLFDGETSRTRLVANLGVGVQVPMQRRGLSLDFELENRFGRTPVQAREGTMWAGQGSWSVQPGTAPGESATRRVAFLNQIRFTVGFTYALGGAAH